MSANPSNPRHEVVPPSETAASREPRPLRVFRGREALQALLAFSSLHEQIRERRAQSGGSGKAADEQVWQLQHFLLDEVLQLVADRARAITGADGIAVALADGEAIVCRAASGAIAPDAGIHLDPHSGFSGACLRGGQIVRSDDSENDPRVDKQACRRLGARSMVAVPLLARQRVIGLLEAFSTEAYGFNDSDVRSLNLLAELIVAALRPEEEDQLAEISERVVGVSQGAALAAREQTPGLEIVTQQAPSPAPRAAEEDAQSAASHPDSQAHSLPAEEPEIEERGYTQVGLDDRTGDDNFGVDNVGVADRTGVDDGPGVDDQLVDDRPGLDNQLGVEPRPGVDEERSVTEPVFTLLSTGTGLRPGLSLSIVLVLLAALAGAGVWWKIAYLQKIFGPRPHPVSETSSAVEIKDAPPSQAPNEAPGVSPAPDPPPVPSPTVDAGKVGALPAVTGVRYWSSSDSSTVVIDLEDQVQYEAHRLADPERIYFDLHDTELAFGLNGRSIDIEDPLLVRVRMAQPATGITRVVLETRGNSSYSVSLEENPYRLVVEVHKPGTKPRPTGTVDLFSPAARPSSANITSTPAGQRTSSSTQASALAAEAKMHLRPPPFRIVLDAGHGGWDLGTVGQRGLLEKDLVLDIVTRLGKLIEHRLGAEVIYTRREDVYLPLERRAEIANLSKADLFLSVHANYSDYASARGVETYYTRTYSSLKARTAETIRAETGREDPSWIKVDIREKVQQSHRLAASIQSSLYGALAAKNPGLRDRGVKQASYVVLTGASMPAILAEVSFVSSPTDESELESSAYRQQIASALFQGLVRYEASAKRERLAETASSRLAPRQLSAAR